MFYSHMRISTFNEIKRYNGIGISCKRHIDNSFTAEPIQQVVSFFKYGYIDKIIFNYLRAKHSSKSSLKIISLGCSLGEEAYSYALVLDDLNPKPSINAFDISSALVTLAEQGKFTLSEIERPLLAPTLKDLYSESEPADDIVRIRKAFKENFEAQRRRSSPPPSQRRRNTRAERSGGTKAVSSANSSSEIGCPSTIIRSLNTLI